MAGYSCDWNIFKLSLELHNQQERLFGILFLYRYGLLEKIGQENSIQIHKSQTIIEQVIQMHITKQEER